jgi:hypothetical protein
MVPRVADAQKPLESRPFQDGLWLPKLAYVLGDHHRPEREAGRHGGGNDQPVNLGCYAPLVSLFMHKVRLILYGLDA